MTGNITPLGEAYTPGDEASFPPAADHSIALSWRHGLTPESAFQGRVELCGGSLTIIAAEDLDETADQS